jgi:plastocyanin
MRLRPFCLVAVLAASACGGSNSHGGHSSDPTIAGAREINVTAKAFSFSPKAITIAPGEKVNVVLKATDIAHDFVIDDPKFAVHASGGKTESGGLVIDRPGTYTFYCSIPGHKKAGMVGTLTVQ